MMEPENVVPRRFRFYNVAHKSLVTVLVGVFIYSGIGVYSMFGELHQKNEVKRHQLEESKQEA